MNKLLSRLSLLTMGAFIALIIGEILVRTIAPQATYASFSSIDAPVFKESDEFPWELSPGKSGLQISPYMEYVSLVATNSIGLRGPELHPAGTTKRILFLGDSFTYGYGVAEPASFARLVESNLNMRRLSGVPIESINAGYAAGYSPDAYYAFLKRKIEILNPSTVVLALYTGNDIEDIGRNSWDTLDQEGLPTKLSTKDFYVGSDGRRRVPRVSILQYEWAYNLHLYLSQFHLYALAKNIGRSIERAYAEGYYCEEWPNGTLGNWEKLKRAIAGLKSISNHHGANFKLVIINDRVQTNDPIWHEYVKSTKCTHNRLKPNQEVLKFCDELKIDCLDLYAPFHNHPDPHSLYFEKDGHWNDAGHQLAATHIADFLDGK